MIFDIYTLVEAIWFILPAYAGNGLVSLLKGRGHVIDGGKYFIDKKPLFGPGKTWEGLILGGLIAGLIGLIEHFSYPYLPWELSPVPLTIIPMSFFLGFVLGIGAMFGDLIGAFFKRRLGLKRGEPAILLDQIDFLIFAFIFASFFVKLKTEWFILLLVITPLIHWFACFIGYLLKLKREPW